MRRLDLNFSPAWRHRFGVHLTGVVLFLCGLSACITAIWHAGVWNAHYQQMLSNLEMQQLKVKKLPNRVPVSQVLLSDVQIERTNVAIRHLNFPWWDLFDAVEGATTPDIALLALEPDPDPDPDHQILRLTAAAGSKDAMLDYVRRLKQQKMFSAVSIKRHQLDSRDPNQVVTFYLMLSLTPMDRVAR